MQGIISLLDEQADRSIRKIWDVLQSHFGCKLVRQAVAPHISWHVAGDYTYTTLHDGLTRLVQGYPPFEIRTAGLGIFLQPAPVLYSAITVTEDVLSFHRRVIQFADPLSSETNPYYQPARWVPHITLAYHDLELDQMGKAAALLAQVDLDIHIRIDNLAIFCEGSDEFDEICRIDFS